MHVPRALLERVGAWLGLGKGLGLGSGSGLGLGLGLGLVPSGLVVGSWPEDMICWPGAAAAALSRYCLTYSASLGTTWRDGGRCGEMAGDVGRWWRD